MWSFCFIAVYKSNTWKSSCLSNKWLVTSSKAKYPLILNNWDKYSNHFPGECHLDNVKFSHYDMSYESLLNSRWRKIFRLFREKSFSNEDHLPIWNTLVLLVFAEY